MPMPATPLLRPTWLALLLLQAAAAQAGVAGLVPDRRPAHAPAVTQAPVGPELKAQRLHGVVPPWPATVERLAEQGAWWAPFFHPGMSGPYDLRGWHRPLGDP